MLQSLYTSLLARLASLGRYVLLVKDVLFILFTHRPSWILLRDQMYHIGVLSLPVVAMTGFSTGLVLAAQSFFQLADKGLTGATGIMVSKAMITELGPVLTGFMVTGRVGAAMCAELGTMTVTGQIDAMHSMAVNPRSYLIAPRFASGILMLPILTIFSVAMGLVGAYLISVHFFGMNPSNFIEPIPTHITSFDLTSGIIKAFVFGILIITISCYKGMSTTGGAAGVGRATTQSVVVCYTFILISNFLLTVFLNLLYGSLQ